MVVELYFHLRALKLTQNIYLTQNNYRMEITQSWASLKNGEPYEMILGVW